MSDLGWDAKEGLKLRRTSLAAQQSSVNMTPVLRETQGLALNLRIMELDAVSREQFRQSKIRFQPWTSFWTSFSPTLCVSIDCGTRNMGDFSSLVLKLAYLCSFLWIAPQIAVDFSWKWEFILKIIKTNISTCYGKRDKQIKHGVF